MQGVGRNVADIAAAGGTRCCTVNHSDGSGLYVDSSRAAGAYVTCSSLGQNTARQQGQAAAPRIDSGIQIKSTICRLDKYITAARRSNGRIHRQSTGYIGTVSHHNGTVCGSR